MNPSATVWGSDPAMPGIFTVENHRFTTVITLKLLKTGFTTIPTLATLLKPLKTGFPTVPTMLLAVALTR